MIIIIIIISISVSIVIIIIIKADFYGLCPAPVRASRAD